MRRWRDPRDPGLTLGGAMGAEIQKLGMPKWALSMTEGLWWIRCSRSERSAD